MLEYFKYTKIIHRNDPLRTTIFYQSSTTKPFHQYPNEILNIYEYQAAISWDNVIHG